MRKHWLIFALGFLVMLIPFMGFPPSFDTKILFVVGLLIIVSAFMAARDFYTRTNRREETSTTTPSV